MPKYFRYMTTISFCKVSISIAIEVQVLDLVTFTRYPLPRLTANLKEIFIRIEFYLKSEFDVGAYHVGNISAADLILLIFCVKSIFSLPSKYKL